MVRGGHGERQGSRRGGGGGVRRGEGRGGAVRLVRVMVRVQVGHARLSHAAVPGAPRGLSRTVPAAPRDDVSVLELGSARLLRRQLQLHKHHVVSNTQRQGERRAAGQEVADLSFCEALQGLHYGLFGS